LKAISSCKKSVGETSKYRGFELKFSADDAYAVLTSRTTFSLALGFVRGFA